MKTYAQHYENATKEIIELAARIHRANLMNISVTYTLPQIAGALRSIYKDAEFHDVFVGTKLSENKWSKGFCALASMAVYRLYGGDKIWEMMTIRPSDWELGPVVFLRDRATGLSFGTTGEHFYPVTIPYELGKPLDVTRLRTPNIDKFMQVLQTKMEYI